MNPSSRTPKRHADRRRRSSSNCGTLPKIPALHGAKMRAAAEAAAAETQETGY
jgi:hypothetical protein